FFQAEDGIRDRNVTGVQTCALPISVTPPAETSASTGSPMVGPKHQTPRPATSATQAVSGNHARRSAGAQGQATSCATTRTGQGRSEERRVGKEGRAGGGAGTEKEAR